MCATLTQRDAAHRQLATAIRMYFADGDLVAAHTLTCAAREIYQKHCKKAGIGRMFNYIQETHKKPEKQLWDILNGARNFFKHPSESLDDIIELRDSDNKAMLFIACHDCAMLCEAEQPVEAQIINIWFLATEFPSDANSDGKDSAVEIIELLDSQFPGLRTASPEEQKRWGLRLLADADVGNLP